MAAAARGVKRPAPDPPRPTPVRRGTLSVVPVVRGGGPVFFPGAGRITGGGPAGSHGHAEGRNMPDTPSLTPEPADPDVTAVPVAVTGAARKAMFIVFLVVFIDLLGFGIVLPLLPLYANRLLGPIYPAEQYHLLHGLVLGALM